MHVGYPAHHAVNVTRIPGFRESDRFLLWQLTHLRRAKQWSRNELRLCILCQRRLCCIVSECGLSVNVHMDLLGAYGSDSESQGDDNRNVEFNATANSLPSKRTKLEEG